MCIYIYIYICVTYICPDILKQAEFLCMFCLSFKNLKISVAVVLFWKVANNKLLQ